MEDVKFDTHGGWDGVSVYTVPVSGKYEVQASSRSASIDWVDTQIWTLQLYKNTVLERERGRQQFYETITTNASARGSCIISCVAGDALEVRQFQNSGGAETLDGSEIRNWVSYTRIGN